MTSQAQQQTRELVNVLIENNDRADVGGAIVDAKRLRRIERKLHRLAELECNGYPVVEIRDGKRYEYSELTEEQQAAIDTEQARLSKKAKEIAAKYGATVTTGGDPRGAVLRLHLKSGRKNGWGDGWYV